MNVFESQSKTLNYELAFSPDPALDELKYLPYQAMPNNPWRTRVESEPEVDSVPKTSMRKRTLNNSNSWKWAQEKVILNQLLEILMSKGDMNACTRSLLALFQVVDLKTSRDFAHVFPTMIEASVMIYERASGEFSTDMRASTVDTLESVLGAFPRLLRKDSEKVESIVLGFVHFLNRNGHRKRAIGFLKSHLQIKEHTKSYECHATCGLLQLEELLGIDPRIRERATYEVIAKGAGKVDSFDSDSSSDGGDSSSGGGVVYLKKRENERFVAKGRQSALQSFGKEASILHQEAKQSLKFALKWSQTPDPHWFVALRQLLLIEKQPHTIEDAMEECGDKFPNHPFILKERLMFSELQESSLSQTKKETIMCKLVMLDPSDSHLFSKYYNLIMAQMELENKAMVGGKEEMGGKKKEPRWRSIALVEALSRRLDSMKDTGTGVDSCKEWHLLAECLGNICFSSEQEDTDAGRKKEKRGEILQYFCDRQHWWGQYHFQDASPLLLDLGKDGRKLKLITAMAAIDTHLFQHSQDFKLQRGKAPCQGLESDVDSYSSCLCTSFTGRFLHVVARDATLAEHFQSINTYGLDRILARAACDWKQMSPDVDSAMFMIKI